MIAYITQISILSNYAVFNFVKSSILDQVVKLNPVYISILMGNIKSKTMN